MNLRRVLQGLALALGAAGAALWMRAQRSFPAPPPAQAEEPAPEGPPLAAFELGRRRLVPQPGSGPRDPERVSLVLLNNEAADLLDAGDLEAAVERFERCHAARPDDAVFASNLAEALARLARRHRDERRMALAAEELARVLELAPGREDAAALADTLARWRKEAELSLGETTDASRYFELTYDAGRDDVLHRSARVLAVLERDYGDLREWFGRDPIVEDGRAPIQVVLYAPRDFDALTGLGDWAAGAFDGTVRISVEDLERERERWPRVARHELCHAFLREVGGAGVPGWLNEGLAQWLEADDAPERAARARAGLARAELFPLERLEGSLASWKDPREIARAYAQSLALVAHVAEHYGESALLAMVEGCGRGEPPAASFERATGVPLAFAAEDLARYLER